jgi:SAM-dependent methyltransferase
MLTEKDKISCEYVELSHYDIIPHVVDFVGAKSYLEIGCADNTCFSRVNASRKIGVDPDRGGTHRMTSDEFFADNKQRFDAIFIDGMHTYQQVKKDFENARKVLNPAGVIFFHDVLPDNRYTAWPTKKGRPKVKGVVAWNGDVWRINFDLMRDKDVDYRMVPNLHGVGILRLRESSGRELDDNDESWEFFQSNWTSIPQLRSMEEIKLFLDLD